MMIILFVVGCSNDVAIDDHQDESDHTDDVHDEPKPVAEKKVEAPVKTITPPAPEPTPSQPAESSVKEFTMTAKQWEFSQRELRVKQGDTVKITISSEDVTHGFSVPAFGVSERLSPGKTEVIEFTADKAGEHSFFCNVPCGSGHRGMKGTLIVE